MRFSATLPIVLAISLASTIALDSETHADTSVELTPHQAIYSLRLASDSPNSRFSGIRGAAVSVVERVCEGWVISEEVVMTMLTTVGGAIEREMQFTARESFDGRSYVFDSRSTTNGNAERYSGTATRSADENAEAEFITPSPFEMDLPDGTLFYLGLTKWLLDLAASGERTGQAFAFDGTDDEGAQKVTVFILPDQGAHSGISGDEALLAAPGWRARLAFFRTEGQVSEPEFEIALRILSNGIVTSFRMIFDDLIVDQVLDDVLPAKDEGCG